MQLAAALVPRGRHAPLTGSVLLQQPEGGSALHSGGTRPAGLWSGAVSGSDTLHVGRFCVLACVD
jgi:hypothetical protein